MKNLKRFWPIAAAALILVVAVVFGLVGVSPKQQQDFRSVVKIGSSAAAEVQAQVDDFCQAELLKPESCAKAQPQTKKIADIAKRINDFVEAHPNLTVSNKQEALGLTDELLKELDGLESVMSFDNPDDRRKFLLYLAIGKSSVRVARIAIDSQPTVADPIPSPAQ